MESIEERLAHVDEALRDASPNGAPLAGDSPVAAPDASNGIATQAGGHERGGGGRAARAATIVGGAVIILGSLALGFVGGRTTTASMASDDDVATTPSSSSAPSTTLPPTTAAPTTLRSTTLPPTTAAPSTAAPTTAAPTTLAGVDPATFDDAQLQVHGLYLAALGRPADRDGRAFWSDQLRNGRPVEEVAEDLLASGEFALGQSDEEIVAGMYRNLLGRAPDPEGVSFWLQRRRDGASFGTILVEFVNSPEGHAAALAIRG